jgi:prolyl oligopeptidase
LLEISPYERVVPDVFPALYVQAGAEDPRCRPWHARKFVARLQAAQRGRAPILLHVWEQAGHGAATSSAIAVDQDAEWLAFLLAALRVPVTVSTVS